MIFLSLMSTLLIDLFFPGLALREQVWDEPAQQVGEVGVELFW
jgi:hypothetical protein